MMSHPKGGAHLKGADKILANRECSMGDKEGVADMSRDYWISSKPYSIEVAALFGTICAVMAYNGYALVASGGMLERIALERLQKNFELYPGNLDLNDSERVSAAVWKYCASKKAGSANVPTGLEDVFGAFTKVNHF